MKNDRREDGEGEMMKNSQGLTDRAKERSGAIQKIEDTGDRRRNSKMPVAL